MARNNGRSSRDRQADKRKWKGLELERNTHTILSGKFIAFPIALLSCQDPSGKYGIWSKPRSNLW
jgi:hypothetical protein